MKPGGEVGGAGSSGRCREESSEGQVALEGAERGARGGRQLWEKPRREPKKAGGSEGSRDENSGGGQFWRS